MNVLVPQNVRRWRIPPYRDYESLCEIQVSRFSRGEEPKCMACEITPAYETTLCGVKTTRVCGFETTLCVACEITPAYETTLCGVETTRVCGFETTLCGVKTTRRADMCTNTHIPPTEGRGSWPDMVYCFQQL
jgi:hypothetical protein